MQRRHRRRGGVAATDAPFLHDVAEKGACHEVRQEANRGGNGNGPLTSGRHACRNCLNQRATKLMRSSSVATGQNGTKT